MEANKDIAVEKETAVNDGIYLDIDKDTMEGQQITVHDVIDSGKSKTANPEDFQGCLSLDEAFKAMRFRKAKEQLRQSRELMLKLRCMLHEKSEDRHEEEQLLIKVIDSLKTEMQRRTSHEFIVSNRHCSQLKKVWKIRGLPVDRETLRSAAASKDAFDMSSLNESLPSKPHTGYDELDSKAKTVTESFLSLCEQTRDFARLKRATALASNPSELNNNLPSCSSEVRQPDTLADTVKKMCRDVKNIRLLSVRSLLRTQKNPCGSSNSSMNSKITTFSELLNFPNSNTDKNNEETITTFSELLNFPNSNTDKNNEETLTSYSELPKFPNSYTDKNNKETIILDGESKLQNIPSQSKEFEKCPQAMMPECFQFVRRCLERSSNVGQQLRDSVLLDRQMSRLKIANSMRSDLSEGMDESEEIKEASSVENKDELDKAAIINRKKALRNKLLSLLAMYKEDGPFYRQQLALMRK